MTTLAVMKARIADDLARSDLTTQIATAISDAIEFYKPQRFFFNETRSSSFVTIAATSTYTSSSDADIGLWMDLDGVYLVDSSGYMDEMERFLPTDMELLLDASAPSGEPWAYTYFEQSFRLYPIPDAVYTVRPVGLIEKAAPATDGEANNVWMVHAYQLIKAHAMADLYTNVIRQNDKASGQYQREEMELNRLRLKTGKNQGMGRIEATEF